MNLMTLEAQYLCSWLFLGTFYNLDLCVHNGYLIFPFLEPSRGFEHEPLIKDNIIVPIGGVTMLSPVIVHTMVIEELKISFHACFFTFCLPSSLGLTWPELLVSLQQKLYNLQPCQDDLQEWLLCRPQIHGDLQVTSLANWTWGYLESSRAGYFWLNVLLLWLFDHSIIHEATEFQIIHEATEVQIGGFSG